MNQQEIAEKLGLSQGYLSKGLSWARNNPRNKVGIKEGILLSEHHIPIHKLQLRLHRLQRTYKILNAVSEAKLSSLKQSILNNNKQYIGLGFRITTQHLEIEGLELFASRDMPIAILEGVAITLADNTAKSIADTYGFLIAQEGHTPVKLTEIELTEHGMAERVKQKGIIELYTDQEGYKVWMDKSFGLGGLESNKTTYIQKLTDMTNDIVEKDAWEQMKAEQVKLSQSLSQVAATQTDIVNAQLKTQETVLQYGKELTRHIPYFESATTANNALLDRIAKLEQPKEPTVNSYDMLETKVPNTKPGLLTRLWRWLI